MRSVADELRSESARAVGALSAVARIELALRLGDEDLALYRLAHGVSAVEARIALARARAIGRKPSCAHDPRP